MPERRNQTKKNACDGSLSQTKPIHRQTKYKIYNISCSKWEKANAAEKVGEKGSESKRGAMHKMHNP